MPNVSRRQKNVVLFIVNALLLLIKLGRAWFDPASLENVDFYWMIGAVGVGVFSLLPVPEKWIELRHASLFLLTGTAIGLRIAATIRDPSARWIVEWIWLAAGLVAVVVHYSPSQQDPYC